MITQGKTKLYSTKERNNTKKEEMDNDVHRKKNKKKEKIIKNQKKKKSKRNKKSNNAYLDHFKDHSKIYLAKKSHPPLKKKERRNVNTFLEGKKLKKK